MGPNRNCSKIASFYVEITYSQVPNKRVYSLNYHTRAIMTRGLYTFYTIFEGQKRFFKEVFSETSAFMYG